MDFIINRAAVKKISDRLCGIIHALRKSVKREDKNMEKTHIGAIWNHLVKTGKCPWITPAYNEYVSKLGDQQRRRKKLVRIGAYYICRKRLKYQYTVISKQRAEEFKKIVA